MILQAKFTRTGGVLQADLGSFQNISDGGYERGFAAGQAAGTDMWQYVTDLSSVFQAAVFPDGYELEVNVPNSASLASFMQSAQGIKKATVLFKADVPPVFISQAFSQSSSLEEVALIREDGGAVPIAALSYAFRNSKVLKKITGVLDLSLATSLTDWSSNSTKLTEFCIAPNSVYLDFVCNRAGTFTDETLASIVDGLGDLTGSATKTLTLKAEAGARLTDAQKATVTAKNWTLVY